MRSDDKSRASQRDARTFAEPLLWSPAVTTPALDIELLLQLPRLAGLAVSRDGSRLVTSVGSVSPDGKRFRSSLWELDPAGVAAPRRLTRSDKGETLGGFLPDGSLVFTSARPDADADPEKSKDGKDRPAALWVLPGEGGEAFVVAAPAGGVDAVAVALDAGTIACYVPTFPDGDADADRKKGDERREKGVGAQLFDGYPIRWWDHYVGPRRRRIAVGAITGEGTERRLELRDLTPDAGADLEECDLDITPGGRTVVTTWRGDHWYGRLVAIDTATGERRTLLYRDGLHLSAPACSPDGRLVVCIGEEVGRPDRPIRAGLWLVDMATGEARGLAVAPGIWPTAVTWTRDSAAVLVSADEKGRVPVWRIDVGNPEGAGSTRLCADGGLTDVRSAPGGVVFALRSTSDEPPHAVALDDAGADQAPRRLRSPGHPFRTRTQTQELWVEAPDGRGRVHSFLTLPLEASPTAPAPLVLFIHGGPYASYNGWHWRWCPHVLAEHGYAVLEVNPALSTGYGWENIDRAWNRWGEVVTPDLVAAVEAACKRPDIDGDRVGAAGGSFGGYMANWLAGHSDRFRCLVTHASLWTLDQFHGTTDIGTWLEEEFGDVYADVGAWLRNSPRTALDAIIATKTPMLVIHGELDARVPVSEALRLWTDLRRHDVPSRFLYFPDENHWILKPHNARIWYTTVLAFLDEHLLGKPFERHPLL
jgi:dipeptidyl aminopeptidase/acylaminoacyl peptidase